MAYRTRLSLPLFVVFFVGLRRAQALDLSDLPEPGFDISDLLSFGQENSSSLRESYNVSVPLPPGWEKFCQLNRDSARRWNESTFDFICLIDKHHSREWKLSTLRSWIYPATKKYIFTLVCMDGAEIFMPWPVKAKNLIGIDTKSCIIKGFFGDSTNKFISSHPNELQMLRITNSVVLIQIPEFIAYMNNVEKQSKEFTCGPDDTVEELTLRNISYTFGLAAFLLGNSTPEASRNLTEYVMDSGGNFLHNTRKIPFVCTFNRLKYIDNSQINAKSRFSSVLLAEKSLFPELLVYNGSYSNLDILGNEFKDWRRFYPNLRTLDFSHNNMREVEFEYPFDKHEQVLQVNLTYNNISELSVETVQRIVGLPNVYIQLRHNPINCQCSPERKELVKFMKNDSIWSKPNYNRYSYLRTLECYFPESAKGKQLISLTEESMLCESLEVSMVTIICFTAVIVILLVIIIVMAKFRREIQILTYTRFNILLPCQASERYQKKLYDAFVSYSNSDEIWVQKTFSALEDSDHEDFDTKSHRFRFCLHQRDFVAGRTIFDNIIQSVESSRHTVIVLSKSFLQSQWCMYEFQEAFQQSILERKRHLIVVLLEDIPKKEMPKDLRRCLNTFTYIHKNDTIFCDRLVYALSYKGKRATMKQEPEESPKFKGQKGVFDNAAFDVTHSKCEIMEDEDKTKVNSSSNKEDKLKSDDNMVCYEKTLSNKHVNGIKEGDNRLSSMKQFNQEYNKQVSFEPNINNSDEDNYVSASSDFSDINHYYSRNDSRECNSCSGDTTTSMTSSVCGNVEADGKEKNVGAFYLINEQDSVENVAFSGGNPDQTFDNQTCVPKCSRTKTKDRLDSGVSTDSDVTMVDSESAPQRTSNVTTDSGVWAAEVPLDTRWSSTSGSIQEKKEEKPVGMTTQSDEEIFI